MNYKEEMKRFFLSNTIDVANKDIYIFGAGDSIQMYQTGLKRSKIWPNFKGYCTDIKQQIGMTLGGAEIVDLESIKDLKNVVILYYSLNKNTVSKMQERLNNISTENYFLDSVILFLARDQIISNFDLISDEESKRVYYEIIKLV